jgi:hypothetical protein
MWEHIDDIIAMTVVVGCFVAIFLSCDGEAWALLGAAAAWCFRSGIESRKKDKK